MTKVNLEHVNITASDGAKTAQKLCDLFDWTIRWEGDAMNGQGRTWHVGNKDSYLAIYAPNRIDGSAEGNYTTAGAMNHIGLTVDDLDAMEERVEAAGYRPHLHADYEPGRRFYFDMEDGLEVELVSYS